SATGTIVIDEKTLSIYVDNPDKPTTQAELEAFSIPTPRGVVPLTDLATVKKAVDSASLPASANVSLGGVTSQQSSSFQQLGLALLAAILIVYVVMVATFKSLRQPLLLLVSIPYAATGAILLQL